MTAPALNIPIRVTGQDDFKRKMQETSALTKDVARIATAQIIRMNAGWLASQGVAGAATIAFGRVLSVLGPIALAITAVTDTFRLMGYAIDLAKKRIAEFSDIADKANASGFSTEFFQRITKSSGEARDKINDLSAALVQFNAASAPKLGGSDLQNRIDELKKAGSLSGNTGIAAFGSANNSEDRLRAIITLINQMMQSGERLAALDLAGRAFGPQITAALRADSGYLDDMLTRADALNKTKIVSDEDLGRAVELKERMEAAEKVLSEKWKPIQDDLAQLGMNYHASWVYITEDLAAAVGYATQLYTALKQVPDLLAGIGNASIWKSIGDASGALGLNSTPESMGIIDGSRLAANAKLTAALQNHANVTKGMREATDVQSAVRGDTSKNPDTGTGKEKDQFDRASEAIERHTARLQADAQAVGLGASALEELRAKAQLLTAAQQAGIPVNAVLIAKIKELAKGAGEAAENLAKAKAASDIKFGHDTALLTPDDAAIAQRLKSIYGDDIPRALNSTEAAALRMNNALKGASDSFQNSISEPLVDFETGAKNAGDAMRDFENQFIRSLLNMVNQALIVKPILSGISSLFGLGGAASLAVPGLSLTGTGGMFDTGGYTGPGGKYQPAGIVHKGEVVFSQDDVSRNGGVAVVEAIRRGHRGYANGGIVGESSALPTIGGTTIVAPNIGVTVQGSPGMSNTDHQKMGENIGKAAMAQIQKMIAKELYTQRRPGGLLQGARR